MKPSHNVDCIEFRGSSLTVVTAVLKTTDVVSLESSLVRRLSKIPDFFSDEPTIIDTSRIDYQTDINWSAIVRLLCSHGLKPFAAKSVHPSHCVSAVRAGLSVIGNDSDTKDFIKDQSRNDSEVGVNTTVLGSTNDRDLVVESLSINYPVRSGQQIYHRGDIVVLNVASSGSELISDGTIHVYAPLRGRALAGASGNVAAMIFTTCFEAELVAISGVYRNFENGIPPQIMSKPVKVSLVQKNRDGHDISIDVLTN
ncbi:Septum site-determining protein MinC [Candidatus Ichthyocystis hellenicum]|uniref:Probable septum site-determining protein MinC n=1 Tax=Candidatus Ichthyocystis hellenicum TaxID=1561003 RepID=A0A0S4M0G6_9BURK|nr:Septum site-determining protein MinC [Candidatus Ichthyocystis hellenicum]